jgi:hypothetical protein
VALVKHEDLFSIEQQWNGSYFLGFREKYLSWFSLRIKISVLDWVPFNVKHEKRIWVLIVFWEWSLEAGVRVWGMLNRAGGTCNIKECFQDGCKYRDSCDSPVTFWDVYLLQVTFWGTRVNHLCTSLTSPWLEGYSLEQSSDRISTWAEQSSMASKKAFLQKTERLEMCPCHGILSTWW